MEFLMGKRTRAPNRTRIHYHDLEKRIAKDPRVKALRLTHECVDTVLVAFFDHAMQALVDFEELYIQGFGQFYRMNRRKQEFLHPKTREPIVLAPRFDVRFKVGLRFKRVLGSQGFPAVAERYQRPVVIAPKVKKELPQIPTDA
jgi:nucleoid DNA-binding protein